MQGAATIPGPLSKKVYVKKKCNMCKNIKKFKNFYQKKKKVN